MSCALLFLFEVWMAVLAFHRLSEKANAKKTKIDFVQYHEHV